MDDLISRQAAIDAARDRMGKGETHIGDTFIECFEMILKALPSAQSDLIAKIQNGIKATDADDVYSCGMRNGMRWCKSLIDGKEPLYENCPSAPPTEASCWGCNCPKMERLKEQKTFSEMVHLHDAETQWIPCSERLPAYGEDVLISIGGYCCNVGHIVSVNEEERYNWYFSGWYHLPNDVDAWMPLPEPWRGEEE